jgi:hypothetical protein
MDHGALNAPARRDNIVEGYGQVLLAGGNCF